jgi:hypothetical protein
MAFKTLEKSGQLLFGIPHFLLRQAIEQQDHCALFSQ